MEFPIKSKAAEKLTGVPPHILHDWDSKGVFKPMKRGGAGQGKAGYRAYSFKDVVALRVASWLRESGMSIQVVKQIASHVQNLQGLTGSNVDDPELRFVRYEDLPKFVLWVSGRTWDLNDPKELAADEIVGPAILVPIWTAVVEVYFLVYLDLKAPADKLQWIEEEAKGETPVARYAAGFLEDLDTDDEQRTDILLSLGIPHSAMMRRWKRQYEERLKSK